MTRTNKAERKRLLAVYGGLYKRHFLNEGYKCFYCGETAQCLDHVPALSTLEGLPKNYLKKNKIPCSLLTCCNECNRILGNKNLPNVFDRLMYLESYYEKLLQKRTNLWDDDEIEELGRGLKDYVKHEQEKTNIYVYKIRAIQLRQIKPETFPTYIEEIDQNGEVTKTY